MGFTGQGQLLRQRRLKYVAPQASLAGVVRLTKRAKHASGWIDLSLS